MSELRIIPENPCYILSAAAVCHGHDEVPMAEPRMAQEPDYRTAIADANLRRRMGRLLKMAVYCGLKALDGTLSEQVSGIITSTGIGFIKDTESFADSIFDRDEELLNPSPFMQSTFNTASGYLALMRKIRAYNTTYVQRASGFASAFADAVMLLADEPGRKVLVGGFDEVTPEVDIVRRRLGIYKDSAGGYMPLGEGAGFFMLSGRQGMARLCGMAPASDNVSDFVNDCLENIRLNDRKLRADEVETARCSGMVQRYGAFCSMLPVMMADGIASVTAPVLYMDDVNPDGMMVLLVPGNWSAI